MSDTENNAEYQQIGSERKSSYQYRALFLKNISLQKRMWCTVICQLITPIICLMLVWIIQLIMNSQFKGGTFKAVEIPIVANNPQVDNFYQQGRNCLVWYLYQFDNGSTSETPAFIGQNTGSGLESETYGLLGNFSNFQENCNKTGREKAPYFVEKFQNQTSANQEVVDIFYEYNITLASANRTDNGESGPVYNLEYVPDGVYTFGDSSSERMTYTISIMDFPVNSFHRLNGISYIRFNIPSWVEFSNQGKSSERYAPKNPDLRLNDKIEQIKRANGISSKSSSEEEFGGTTLYPAQIIVPEGFLQMMDTITKAFMGAIGESTFGFVIAYMPIVLNTSNYYYALLNVVASSFYPFALALGLPMYMYTIVHEKENRIREMMKMNGMNMGSYWTAMVTYNFIIYSATALLFWVLGFLLLNLNFFNMINILPMIIMLMGWGVAQIGMSIFFSVFINNTTVSSVLGYILSMFLILVATSYNAEIYSYPNELPIYYLAIPHFSFSRLVYLFGVISSTDTRVSLGTYWSSSECFNCIFALYFIGIGSGLAGVYLNEVIKQSFGVRRGFCFCLKTSKRRPSRKNQKLVSEMEGEKFAERLREVEDEDDDCRIERNQVAELDPSNTILPLVIHNIRKVYHEEGTGEDKVAVRCLSLSVKPGETFGLLGPNGAGKTSLIAMLTGLYPPEEGNAWVNGYDIRDCIDKVHLYIGVCPQFDLLWPELTVEEHLLFYGRLKGFAGKELTEMVQRAANEVGLGRPIDLNKQSKRLSGGMRRRLSVAISLVGNPKIVFLDEPTTGLDPDNKRQLWDILTNSRGKRAIVITTHSMEEADVLCSRIGIMAFGMIRCIAPQIRLKKLYGDGYRININLIKKKDMEAWNTEAKRNGQPVVEALSEEENVQRITEIINRHIQGVSLVSHYGTFVVYKIDEGESQFFIGDVFDIFEKMKEMRLLNDWMIAQSTLDNVFMNVVETAEQNDKKKGMKIQTEADS